MRQGLPKPFGLVACALIASAAYAQTPSSVDPARIGERFDEPALPSAQTPLSTSTVSVGASPSTAPDTRFVLRDVVVEGSTVYGRADLAPLYSQFIGTEVSAAQLAYIANAISAKYRADGYLFAYAIPRPSQSLDGTAHIEVVEGYIADVQIEGDVADRRGLVRRTLAHITRSRPTRRDDLERYVLLADDLPGVSVRTSFWPSEQAKGAMTLIVHVEQDRLGGFAAIDNRGSEAIGPEQISAGMEANSLLALSEQTAVIAATAAETKELAYLAVRHEETLTSEGLRLTLTGAVTRTQPGGALASLHALGKGEVYGVRLSTPLVRSRGRTFTAGAAFNYLNSTTELSSAPYSEDRVRTFSADAIYDRADFALGRSRPAVSRFRVMLTHGLDVLDATEIDSPMLSRAGAKSDFTKLNVDALRVQTVAERLSIALAASGQIASGPLLSSQQFGLGGAQFGRGYEPSELTGDHGLAASIEGRYALPPTWLFANPELYAFYEGGAVWMKAPTPEIGDGRSLSSAGIGVRFGLGPKISIQLELAKPLTRPIASRGDKDVRPLFSIATRF